MAYNRSLRTSSADRAAAASQGTTDAGARQQAWINDSPRQLLQFKKISASYGLPTASGGVQLQKKGKMPVLQAKFFKDKKPLSEEKLTALRRHIPAEKGDLLTMLTILATNAEEIDIDNLGFKSPKDFVKYLENREADYRPFVSYYREKEGRMVKGTAAIPGKLSIDQPGTLENWGVGKSTAHQVPNDLVATDETDLTHVTFDSSNLNYKRVDPNYGSNPGEFGTGFYTTTGHETAPQVEVSKKWGNAETGKSPKHVVRFRFKNADLRKLVDTDEQAAFLRHMLQASNGYPQGMSEEEAIDMMNAINKKGKVLLFPDDKERSVSIDEEANMTWSEYTNANAGGSDHSLVIGPQRPPELTDIRQVAFRGAMGEYLINSAKRSFQTIK
ncbi:hypothetical protein [Spirosoma sp.]|uniref:hypothetical protein n=1 Tax=Spirosoma sp. TaxID=1899569 RepID=UPI00261DAE4F|nr:hypothetical protein [Spirosoma sp.]MCX6219083.1 hypothetical protein [Spirosoma sp.]